MIYPPPPCPLQRTPWLTRSGSPAVALRSIADGKWENFNAVPPVAAYDLVDACNGHFGTNPDSPAAEVYHYHVTDLAPFTTGCFGPALDDDNAEVMVTIAACRAAHAAVRQLRHPFGPFLARFSASPHPARAVCCVLLGAHTDRAVIGAWDPML